MYILCVDPGLSDISVCLGVVPGLSDISVLYPGAVRYFSVLYLVCQIFPCVSVLL